MGVQNPLDSSKGGVSITLMCEILSSFVILIFHLLCRQMFGDCNYTEKGKSETAIVLSRGRVPFSIKTITIT